MASKVKASPNFSILKIVSKRPEMTGGFSPQQGGVEERLEAELKRLQPLLGLEPGLKVVWRPGGVAGLSGEVKGGVVYIYEAEEGNAVETLKHELMDYALSNRLVEPLVALINLLKVQ